MPTLQFTERNVVANGQRIHLHMTGDTGPLVLLCHGFPESWCSWRRQMQVLAREGYRAVALDMLGYGRSSKPIDPTPYGVLELTKLYVDVVRALGEKTAVIVGHDAGAPSVWTAAWTRPDVFSAVVGMSVPFGASGLHGLPDSPFGEMSPGDAGAKLAGPGRMFYQEYLGRHWQDVSDLAEKDYKALLTATFYTLSADLPLPSAWQGVNLVNMRSDKVREFIRAAMSLSDSKGLDSIVHMPPSLPAWLEPEILDYYTGEFEYGGMIGPLNYYKTGNNDWKLLAPQQGRPLTVPALFIGGDRDVVTIWAQDAIRRAPEHITDLRGTIIIPHCGHWQQEEQPEAVNEALLGFLASVKE